MGHLLALGALGYAVYWLFFAADAQTIILILSSAIVLGAVIFLFMRLNEGDRADRYAAQERYIQEQAEKYQEHLARKRQQLITRDDYGDVDESRWRQEIVYFFNNKIGAIPATLAISPESPSIDATRIAFIIEEVAKRGQERNATLFPFNEGMTGIEYEHFCAEQLRSHGWETNISQASNDQGADIIAQKGNVTAAVQCKKYSSPVGNKAVQEAHASISFYDAQYGVVVTNSSFTPSAKRLAKSTGVILLHHSELNDLHDRIGRSHIG